MLARPSDNGSPGASARARADRLRARRELTAGASPVLVRILRTLAGPPAAERRLIREEAAWRTGAEGEEILANVLSRRCPDVLVLHDRRIPGRRANIDHVAFAPSGVYVIDTKRYRGRIAAPAGSRLVIDRRDETALIGKLHRQLDVVGAALASIGEDVPVHGCLCFVAPAGFLAEAKLPALRTLRVDGIPLYNARRLARHLNRPGPVSAERALRLHAELALRLPPAG